MKRPALHVVATRSIVALAALGLLGGCAWSNPDNRPVWNTFERTVVPDSDGAFYAALPLTVPLGLLAIVADTLVAHPIQVIDDAFADAADLWRDGAVDFENAYYTELGFAIPRAVATPVTFGVSFLGRAMFDISPRWSDEERAELEREHEQRAAVQRQRADEQAHELLARWLLSGGDANEGAVTSAPFADAFEEPLRRMMAGDAATRGRLHVGMLSAGRLVFGPYRAEAGLADPDPVVRYLTIGAWPRGELRPEGAVLESLLQDPVESVRLLAIERFGR